MDWMLVVILVLGGLAIWGFVQIGKDNQQKQGIVDQLTSQLPGGSPVLMKKAMAGALRGIGFGDGELILVDNQTSEVLPISGLVSAEVITDNATVQKVSRSSQVVGGLAGAALAGPVGAIIGGLGASSRTASAPPKAVKLRLITTSRNYPKFDVDFIEMTATGNTQGLVALDEAETWFARIQGMLHEYSATNKS